MRQAYLFKLAAPASNGAHFANLSGDYTYMTSGYYDSLDAELNAQPVMPTTEEALDAYVVPLAMEKANRAGLGVPQSMLVVDKFPPAPVMCYPVNPFSSKGELLTDEDMIRNRKKALTMTGKYAAICQQLPEDYRIDVVRAVLGTCLNKEYSSFVKDVYDVFNLPLMRIRVIVTAKAYLLSAIDTLPYDTLTINEKKLLEGAGTWQN